MYGIEKKQVHASRRSTYLLTLNHSLNILLLITEHASDSNLQPHRLHISPCLLQEHGEGNAVSRQCFCSLSRSGHGRRHPLNWRTGWHVRQPSPLERGVPLGEVAASLRPRFFLKKDSFRTLDTSLHEFVPNLK